MLLIFNAWGKGKKSAELWKKSGSLLKVEKLKLHLQTRHCCAVIMYSSILSICLHCIVVTIEAVQFIWMGIQCRKENGDLMHLQFLLFMKVLLLSPRLICIMYQSTPPSSPNIVWFFCKGWGKIFALLAMMFAQSQNGSQQASMDYDKPQGQSRKKTFFFTERTDLFEGFHQLQQNHKLEAQEKDLEPEHEQHIYIII